MNPWDQFPLAPADPWDQFPRADAPQQADAFNTPPPAQGVRRDPRQAGINALIGFGAAAAEPVLGLGQLGTMAGERLGIPGSSAARADLEERTRTIRDMRKEAGGWGTAGEIAGFAAGGLTTAAPKVFQKALGKLPGILQPAARGGALGATEQGAYEASRPVLSDDPTRGERALQGAAFGGAGGAVGGGLPQALSRIVEPIRMSEPAKRMSAWMRQRGVEPQMSSGQAAGTGSMAGAFEEALQGLPLAGRVVDRVRGAGVEAWDRAQLSDIAYTASGRMQPIATHGPDAVRQAQDAVRQAYRIGTQGRQLQIAPTDFTDSLNAIQRLPPSTAPDAESLLNVVANDIASGNVTEDGIIRLRSTLSNVASKAYRDGDYELGKVIDKIKDDYQTVLERGASPEQLGALRRADSAYGKLVDYQNAAATQGALTQGGMVAPNQLISSIRRGEPASSLSAGKTPGLAQAQEAQEVFGNALPRPGPGTAEKMLAAGLLTGGGVAGGMALTSEDPLSGGLFGAAAVPALAAGMFGTRAGRALLTPGMGDNLFQRGRVGLADLLRDPRLADALSHAGARAGVLYGNEELY